jgi:hypothetical protein
MPESSNGTPGPFGWVANLMRWSQADRRVGGTTGPLPPSKASGSAKDGGASALYQGLDEGWYHNAAGAALSSFFSEPRTRKDLYVLFERMDMTDIVGSFLDLVSEDATAIDTETGKRMWSECSNDALQGATDALLDRLKVEEDCPALARDLAKFGDNYERLVYRSGVSGGVRRMLPVPAVSMTRKEDKEGNLDGYVELNRRHRNGNSEVSYPWDYAHFRVRGRDRRYPYGTSLLHNGIRPWKQFLIFDDWVMAYTTQRHPDRNAVILDIGTASETEAAMAKKGIEQQLRKGIVVDVGAAGGQNMRQQYKGRSVLDDIVIPVRPDSRTDIKKLAGSGNATDVVPLLLAIQRFYSAVRAPKEYFGFSPEGVPTVNLNPKASLTNQDVRYARVVQKLQSATAAGYRYVAELNAMLMASPSGDKLTEGLDLRALDVRVLGNSIKIHMAPISFLEELELLSVFETRQQVAIAMLELGLSNPAVDIINWTDYIFREIVRVPDADRSRIIRSELDMENIDNVNAGLLPDGTHPNAKAAQERARHAQVHAQRINEEHRHGDISKKDKDLLSEAIMKNPALRDAIILSRRLFEKREVVVPHTGALPKSELITAGHLADSLTEEDVQGMVQESVRAATGHDMPEPDDDET